MDWAKPIIWTLVWMDSGHIYIAYFNLTYKFIKIYDSTASKLLIQKRGLSRMEVKNTYLKMREDIKEKENDIIFENGRPC